MNRPEVSKQRKVGCQPVWERNVGHRVGYDGLGVGSWMYVWTYGLKMVDWMNCWTGSWPGVIKHYEVGCKVGDLKF